MCNVYISNFSNWLSGKLQNVEGPYYIACPYVHLDYAQGVLRMTVKNDCFKIPTFIRMSFT